MKKILGIITLLVLLLSLFPFHKFFYANAQEIQPVTDCTSDTPVIANYSFYRIGSTLYIEFQGCINPDFESTESGFVSLLATNLSGEQSFDFTFDSRDVFAYDYSQNSPNITELPWENVPSSLGSYDNTGFYSFKFPINEELSSLSLEYASNTSSTISADLKSAYDSYLANEGEVQNPPDNFCNNQEISISKAGTILANNTTFFKVQGCYNSGQHTIAVFTNSGGTGKIQILGDGALVAEWDGNIRTDKLNMTTLSKGEFTLLLELNDGESAIIQQLELDGINIYSSDLELVDVFVDPIEIYFEKEEYEILEDDKTLTIDISISKLPEENEAVAIDLTPGENISLKDVSSIIWDNTHTDRTVSVVVNLPEKKEIGDEFSLSMSINKSLTKEPVVSSLLIKDSDKSESIGSSVLGAQINKDNVLAQSIASKFSIRKALVSIKVINPKPVGCELEDDGQPNVSCQKCIDAGGIWIAIGCVDPTPLGIMTRIVQTGIGVMGGVALVQLIIVGLYLQSGQEAKIAEGKKKLIATLTGIVVLVFSVLILRIIGVNVLDAVPGGFL